MEQALTTGSKCPGSIPSSREKGATPAEFPLRAPRRSSYLAPPAGRGRRGSAGRGGLSKHRVRGESPSPGPHLSMRSGLSPQAGRGDRTRCNDADIVKHGTSIHILAAAFARVLLTSSPSFKTEGAGKAGWPHAPGAPRKKLREKRVDHRYRRGQPGLPCAVVLRLICALPGEPSRLPPSSPRASRSRELSARPRGARTTQFRRPRQVPLVSQHHRVHRIPASRVVTTAIRPSAKRRDAQTIRQIRNSENRNIFTQLA
jgi:hypothetical protein